jgi:CRP/FNR family transcriptional regulator, cyclic AMP receptor protein
MNDVGASAETAHFAEPFDHRHFSENRAGATTATYADGHTIYAQGDAADALYFLIEGAVTVTRLSEDGKQGIIALFSPGSFFGKDCFYSRRRVVTAAALVPCELMRIPRDVAICATRDDPDFTRCVLAYAIVEHARLRDELIDHMFNSSEKRLARILLTLADLGPDEGSRVISIPVTQETLAQMVGTTRPRISRFMNKFRALGYIEYNGKIRVRSSLTKAIADDERTDLAC